MRVYQSLTLTVCINNGIYYISLKLPLPYCSFKEKVCAVPIEKVIFLSTLTQATSF